MQYPTESIRAPTKEPVRCPYCGSIETNGYTCKWCRNIINSMEVYQNGNHNDPDSYAGADDSDCQSADCI